MLFRKETSGIQKERIMGSLKSRIRRFTPMNRRSLSEKASPGSRSGGVQTFPSGKRRPARAGLTVESACVLPLFLFGLMTMISLLDLYKEQTVHLTALCQEASMAGLEAAVPGQEGPEEITRTDVYGFRPPALLLPFPGITIRNSICVHAWTGSDGIGSSGAAEPEEMVYVTETGHVFHLDPDCTYLHLSIHSVSGSSVAGLHNLYGDSYSPCEICSYHQAPGAYVYITDQGTRYHNQGSCSGLKRTVRLVRLSEASGYTPCTRCEGGEE